MIKTTIFLHRIGEKLFSRECDAISVFYIVEKPEDEYISKIIQQKFGFEMVKGEGNSFVTEDNRIEVRYHHWDSK